MFRREKPTAEIVDSEVILDKDVNMVAQATRSAINTTLNVAEFAAVESAHIAGRTVNIGVKSTLAAVRGLLGI